MDFKELIDVYFVLADAYIEQKQLKLAERYLSTAYTVFFKKQEDAIKASKGVLSADSVMALNDLRAELCKLIGKLKKAKGDFDDSIKQFSYSVILRAAKGRTETHNEQIYLGSLKHGPESYMLTARYYLLAESLRSQGKVVESRNVLRKVVTIWNTTLCDKIRGSVINDPDIPSMTEAMDYLKNALIVLENELGPTNALVGECTEAIGLIEMVRGDNVVAAEYLQKAVEILNAAAGPNDKRTEDAQMILKIVCLFVRGFRVEKLS